MHTCRLSRWHQWVWRNSEGQHSEQGGLLGPHIATGKSCLCQGGMFEGLNIVLLFEQERIRPKMCNLFTLCILHILPTDFVGLDSKDPTQCIQACYLHRIQWLHCCMMTQPKLQLARLVRRMDSTSCVCGGGSCCL